MGKEKKIKLILLPTRLLVTHLLGLAFPMNDNLLVMGLIKDLWIVNPFSDLRGGIGDQSRR